MTESEFAFLGEIHRMLNDTRNKMQPGETRDQVEDVRKLVFDRFAAGNKFKALTWHHHGGFVITGPGTADIRLNPGYEGLDDALEIFSHGSTVSATLHATDLVGPCPYPGNTLGNRLRRAADWFDQVGCREHANAVRSISVSKTGRITVARPVCIE